MLNALQIIFSDNHLLALNKPPGLLTQPSGTDRDSLEDQAKAWIKEELKKPGGVYLHAVHRLDRPVSGVVLFARTQKALSRLNEEMRAGRVVKIYHAVTEKRPPQKSGTLEHHLTHSNHQARIAEEPDPEARTARLEYRVLSESKGVFLLEINLHTGRYHQIRAQLSAVGCPVVGDLKYGSSRALPGGQVALHHRRMEVSHPTKKEILVFEANYPAGWLI